MGGNKCRACPDVRQLRIEGWSGCSKRDDQRRLCRQIDLTLLAHLPNQPLESLDRVNRVITERVFQLYLDPPALPESPPDFLAWLLEQHRKIFGALNLDFAGQFRTDDVWFGRESTLHERQGARPPQIEEDLKVYVFGKFQNAASPHMSLDTVFRTMAIFLQTFFEVHPFADGNGRIARLFIASFASTRQLQFVAARGGDRDYVPALEEAHKWCARHSAARTTQAPGGDRRPLDPHARLMAYLKRCFVQEPAETFEQLNPRK